MDVEPESNKFIVISIFNYLSGNAQTEEEIIIFSRAGEFTDISKEAEKVFEISFENHRFYRPWLRSEIKGRGYVNQKKEFILKNNTLPKRLLKKIQKAFNNEIEIFLE